MFIKYYIHLKESNQFEKSLHIGLINVDYLLSIKRLNLYEVFITLMHDKNSDNIISDDEELLEGIYTAFCDALEGKETDIPETGYVKPIF